MGSSVPALCPECGAPAGDRTCSECGTAIVLGGRFVLEAEIGTGAAGITYRGRDDQGWPVAIKRFDLSRTRDPKRLALIDRECSVLRQLRHARIPRYVDHFVIGTGLRTRLFLVQGFVDGKDLGAWMAEHRFTEAEILDVVERLLDVLDYLHGLSPPVLHRDIKPRNVILEASTGELFLVDFGSVQDELKGDLGGSTVTGTFGYMAPEQLGGDASAASDLYGLGALAICLATRREPHTMLDYANRLRWKEHAGASAATASFLDRMVAPDLGERLRDVSSARAALEMARRGVVPQAQSAPFTTPASPVTWRNSRPLASMATRSSSGPGWRVRRPRTGEDRELSLDAIWRGQQNGWLEPTDRVVLDDRSEAILGGHDLEQLAVQVHGAEGQMLFQQAVRSYDLERRRKRSAALLAWLPMILIAVGFWSFREVRKMVGHPETEPPVATAPPVVGVDPVVVDPIPVRQVVPGWPTATAGDPVVAEKPVECRTKVKVHANGSPGTVVKPSGESGCDGPFATATMGAALSWVFEPGKLADGTAGEAWYRVTFRFNPDGTVELVPPS